jgi:hypothetical protein
MAYWCNDADGKAKVLGEKTLPVPLCPPRHIVLRVFWLYPVSIVPSMNNNITLGQIKRTVLVRRRTLSWMALAKQSRWDIPTRIQSANFMRQREGRIRISENNIKEDQVKKFFEGVEEFDCLRVGPTDAPSKPSQGWSTSHKMWRLSWYVQWLLAPIATLLHALVMHCTVTDLLLITYSLVVTLCTTRFNIPNRRVLPITFNYCVLCDS